MITFFFLPSILFVRDIFHDVDSVGPLGPIILRLADCIVQGEEVTDGRLLEDISLFLPSLLWLILWSLPLPLLVGQGGQGGEGGGLGQGGQGVVRQGGEGGGLGQGGQGVVRQGGEGRGLRRPH